MGNNSYINVTCKTCGKEWEKRNDTLKLWSGNCLSCSKKLSWTPEKKEKMHKGRNKPEILAKVVENSRKQCIKQRGIPNARKITSEMAKGKNNYFWKGGKPICKCGKQLASYKAKQCHACYSKSKVGIGRGEEYKKKLKSVMPRGEQHWNWKGGISEERKVIQATSEYKEWRKQVFKRDNYQCVLCKRKTQPGDSVVLNADHILPFSQYPEKRFDLDNGRTLCQECHRKTPTYGWKSAFSKSTFSNNPPLT